MNRTTALVLCCVVSFAAGAGFMWAQQGGGTPTVKADDTAAVAAPEQQAATLTRREPQLENDLVRSWKSIIMPNQQLSLHRHENGRVLVALTGGPLNVVDKDGNILKTYNWEKGKAYWLDADPPGQMHADVNATGVPIEVIVVELQKKGG